RPDQTKAPEAAVIAEPGLALLLQLALQGAQRIGQARLVFLADGDRITLLACLEQAVSQLAVRRAEVISPPLARQNETTARSVRDLQVLADGHVGQPDAERARRRKPTTQSAMPEIAGLHRAHALRPLEQRDDHTLLRVAANAIPGTQVEQQQADQRQRADAQAEIVQQGAPGVFRGAWSRHQPGRPVQGNRKAMMGGQLSGSGQAQVVIATFEYPEIPPLIPFCTRIGRRLADARSCRQMHLDRSLADGKYPA